jgi:hypothetical protein
MVEVKIDQETLSKQEGALTEDQAEAIALAAIQEMDSSKKPPEDKEPGKDEQDKEKSGGALEGDTGLTDDELVSAKDEELSEEQKTKKVVVIEERKKKEEERLLNAKEIDLSEEDKTAKAVIVKAQEESKGKANQQELEAYAKEHSISVEEAKADFESVGKIQEKYKGDPKLLARANLHLQRLYSKTEAELKDAKGAKPPEPSIQDIPVEAVEKWMAEGKVLINGKSVTKEQVIDAYRNAYPDLTDTLEDDKVFKLAVKEYKQKLESVVAEQKSQIGVKAKEKRDTLLSGLSEADKQYLPEIKPLIEKLPDTQVMNESFNLETYITYAKGIKVDETIKRLEQEKKEFGEKEYQRGVEEAKILGLKKPPDGKPPKSKDFALSDAQKKRAKEMFDNPDITEEAAYKLYKDYLKETNQV